MKTPRSSHVTRTLRHLVLTGAVALPSLASAADWIGETGPFGTDANWSTGAVPVAEAATISNGGTAQIVDGDEFFVSPLFLGGHSGVGSLDISGGMLNVIGGPHNAYFGGDNTEGGTGVGNLTMSGGSVIGSGGEMLFGSRGGTANVTMTGGTISNDNWIIFGRDGGGTANVNLSGTAIIDKTGSGNIAIGIFSGTTSTITMNAGASISSNNAIYVGWGNGAGTKGVLDMSGDSEASSGGNFIIALREGGSVAPSGEMHMSGNATVTAGNEFYVGNGTEANAVLAMQDSASVTVTNGLIIGRQSSIGTMTLSNNAQAVAHGYVVVGADGSGNGTLTINDSASVSADRMIWVGQADSSSGVVNLNGGTLTGHEGLPEHDTTGAGVAFRGASGTMNLNGGTLETPGFNKTSGTVAINFNGTTIKATGMTTTGSFFNNIESSELNVQAGGAKFDTNGNVITIVQNLAGVGGLVKMGLGDLILLGTVSHLGDTVVEAGTLSITTGTLADTSNIWLSTGSIFDLDFAGTDTVNALFIEGVAQSLGTWGSLASTATNKSELFTGMGVIEVTSMVPEPSTFALLGIAAAGVWIARRRKNG